MPGSEKVEANKKILKNKEVIKTNAQKQAFDINTVLEMPNMQQQDKDSYLDRMIRRNINKNLQLQAEMKKQVSTDDFVVLNESEIPVQKLPAERDTWKARRNEASAVKTAKKVFANADVCTVREVEALNKYFATFKDGKPVEIKGEDVPFDPELTAYVDNIINYELTDKQLTDDYLADHMGELFEYKRRLSEYDSLRQKYPKFFDALPTEKTMILEEKVSIASSLGALLEGHLSLHGVKVDYTENGPVVGLIKNNDKSKAKRQEDEAGYKEVHETFYKQNILNHALIVANRYTISKSFTSKATLEKISNRISGNKAILEKHGKEIESALSEVKNALLVRDDLISLQKEELAMYHDLPVSKNDGTGGSEKDLCANRIKANNARIRISTAHVDHYKAFLDFICGNINDISKNTLEFLQSEGKYDLAELVQSKYNSERRELRAEKKYKYKLYDEKVKDLTKIPVDSDKENQKLKDDFEKLMDERKEYYSKLIDEKVTDQKAREYYKDLILLNILVDRRKMGYVYDKETENLSENKRITVFKRITDLIEKIQNNPYRKSAAKLKSDKLFEDSFLYDSEDNLTEQINIRKSSEVDLKLSRMTDNGDTHSYASKYKAYIVNSTAEQEDTSLSSAIATQKLSEKLGISELIPKIEKISVTDEKGQKYGGISYTHINNACFKNISELKELQNEKGANICFSDQAIKQMSAIRLLTYLIGDTSFDGDQDIYFSFLETGEYKQDPGIIMVTAAKMNFSGIHFSLKDNTDITKGNDQLPSLSSIQFPLLDSDLVDTILGMKKEDIRGFIGENLSSEQILYFEKRLSAVQTKLSAIKNEDTNKADDDKVIVKKETMPSREMLKKLQNRISSPDGKIFNEAIQGQKILGANTSDWVDEEGKTVVTESEQKDEYIYKMYTTITTKLNSEKTTEGKVDLLNKVSSIFLNSYAFRNMDTYKDNTLDELGNLIFEHNMTKEVHKLMYLRYFECRKKIAEQYEKVSKRLKNEPLPDSFKETEEYKRAVKFKGLDKAEKNAKKAYIHYVMLNEKPELAAEYNSYMCYNTKVGSVISFGNRTNDVGLYECSNWITNIHNELLEEKPELKSFEEKYTDLLEDFVNASLVGEEFMPKDLKKQLVKKLKDGRNELAKKHAYELFDKDFVDKEYKEGTEKEDALDNAN